MINEQYTILCQSIVQEHTIELQSPLHSPLITYPGLFFLRWGVMAYQDNFTHLSQINHRVGRKQEIPQKKHLTICKQNLACLTYDPSYARTHSGEMTSNLER